MTYVLFVLAVAVAYAYGRHAGRKTLLREFERFQKEEDARTLDGILNYDPNLERFKDRANS